MPRKKTKRKPKKNVAPANILQALYRNQRRIFILISVIFISLAFFGLKYFFLNNKVFSINTVIVTKGGSFSYIKAQNELLDAYRGRNIFTVDLKHIEVLIKEKFPEFKRVEITRLFPDTLEANIVQRTPVAIIYRPAGVLIDSDGVVIIDKNAPKSLIEINGVNFTFRTPRSGETLNTRPVSKAIELIGFIKKAQINDVQSVDVSDTRNITIETRGVTVKMGEDNFAPKLKNLKNVFSDPKVDPKDIAFIDLRFAKPVIKPR